MSKPMLIVTRQTANDGSILVHASIEQTAEEVADPAVHLWDQYSAAAAEGQNVRYVITNNNPLFSIGIERGGVSIIPPQGQDLEMTPGDVLVVYGAGTFQRIELPSGAGGYPALVRGMALAVSPDEDIDALLPDPARREAERLFAENMRDVWQTAPAKWKSMMIDDLLEIHRNAESRQGASIPLEKTYEVFAKRLGIWNVANVVPATVLDSFTRSPADVGPGEKFVNVDQMSELELAKFVQKEGLEGVMFSGQDVRGSLAKAAGWAYLTKELGMDLDVLAASGEGNLSKVIYLRLAGLEDAGELGPHEALWNELQSAQKLINQHRDIFSTSEKREAFRRGVIQAYAMEASGFAASDPSREGRSPSVEVFMKDFLKQEIAESHKREALIDEARLTYDAFRKRTEDRREEKLEGRK